MRILMVMSSAHNPDLTPEVRLARLKAFAAPFYLFTDAGHDVILASPLGGAASMSWAPPAHVQDQVMMRFREDRNSRDLLSDTLATNQVFPEDLDLVFYPDDIIFPSSVSPGLPDDPASRRLLSALWDRVPITLVGASISVLCGLEQKDGAPLMRGRRVIAPTSADRSWRVGEDRGERGLADALLKLGARLEHKPIASPQIVVDNLLVTARAAEAACLAAETALALVHP